MCGIYGSTKLYSRETFNSKLNSMIFRGPDYQEFKQFKINDDRVLTLGHVRLSIVDLDKRSNQPFQYNENISIVFNGEIYNYQCLKQQYLPNITFRTKSDTEVICAMYEKFGADCVNYLNGMFSFVIYDKKMNILYGARDRLGKKPFYYYLTSDSFEFASQLTPLYKENDFAIEEISRQYYLLDGYIPDPYCIFKGIKKLRAGQRFTLSLDNHEMKVESYWDIFSNSCKFTAPKSYEEAKDIVRELLYDSVKIRLNADVPVGLFLSGGIDSSLVCAITSLYNKQITAFSIGFNDGKYDESKFAAEVAQSIGITFQTEKCEGSEMLRMFDSLSHYYDEPFADFSLIPSCLLAEKTRRSATVALGGDGADELFLGYYNDYSRYERYRWMYKTIPAAIRNSAVKMIDSSYIGYHMDYIKYNSVEEAYIGSGRYGLFYGAEKFDRVELAKSLPDNKYFNKDRGVLQFSDVDIKHYMNSCINTKVDRATMRSSLELRSPMMDYRLAEYSRLLPFEYQYSKITGGKRILKDILYSMVPRNILDRPKRGFSPPINQWFRHELHDKLIEYINKDNICEFFPELDANKIVRLRDAFLKGKQISALPFLKIYLYIDWYKTMYRA